MFKTKSRRIKDKVFKRKDKVFKRGRASIESVFSELDGTDCDISHTVLRTRVYENPYARIQLPEGLFRGEWDERFGPVDEYIERKYAGQKVRSLETMLTDDELKDH